MRILALVIVGIVTFCGNAFAWGDHEHKVVCEIAMRLAELIRWYGSAADPAVRAQAHTLIAEAMRHFARLEPAAW